MKERRERVPRRVSSIHSRKGNSINPRGSCQEQEKLDGGTNRKLIRLVMTSVAEWEFLPTCSCLGFGNRRVFANLWGRKQLPGNCGTFKGFGFGAQEEGGAGPFGGGGGPFFSGFPRPNDLPSALDSPFPSLLISLDFIFQYTLL